MGLIRSTPQEITTIDRCIAICSLELDGQNAGACLAECLYPEETEAGRCAIQARDDLWSFLTGIQVRK